MPVAWKPILLWLGIGLAGIAIVIWPIAAFAFQRAAKFPACHRDVLQSLARPLGVVQEQALTYGPRDVARMHSAKTEAEELVSQIPYDSATVETVRDFLQACVIVTDIHHTADDMRKAREDVARIAPGLFRQLHNGVSVDRRKVDLPKWCERQIGTHPRPSPAQIGELNREAARASIRSVSRDKPVL